MIKNYLLGFCCIISTTSFSQIGINTIPHESTIFDMSESKKGFLLSKIELTNSNASEPVNNVKDGVIVYNSTISNDLKESYYVWNNNNWEPLFNENSPVKEDVSIGIHASVLGYNPDGEGNNAPEHITFEGIEANKVKDCVKFTDSYKDAIEHTYCAYQFKKGINWEQAFNFAKNLKGYLTVISTNPEWESLNKSLISIDEAKNSKIWIGYNRITIPGNSPEFTWITGEKSMINWSNNSTLQANFSTAPSANCVYIANNSTKTWESSSCELTDNQDYIIVEFQK